MGIPTEIITYALKTNTTTSMKNNKSKHVPQDIFSYLEQQLKNQTIQDNKLPFPFHGGFVGYFGYELKALTGTKKKPQQSPFPDSLWFSVKNFLAFDHKEKTVYLVSLENKTNAEKWFTTVKKKLSSVILNGVNNPNEIRSLRFAPRNDDVAFQLSRSHQQYLNDIAICKEYLAKGDAYQLCLTNSLTPKTNIDPLQLYLQLRKNNPAPYAGFIRYDDLSILCSSPEEFLKIENGIIETKPMKGTIKRGGTPKEDQKLLQQLANSKKDWSENAMIVDLLRNDLGKICTFGSVKVNDLMTVESYQTVHTLVSTITGKLRQDVSIIDCIKACFPGGSMTGAPKIRAMEILETLEKAPRGIYSGALGFLGNNNTAHLGMIIRTMVIKDKKISIGAGGAILMDSDPEKEYQEMLLKADALINTIRYNTSMHTVYLALGSNIGNKKQNITEALQLLKKHVTNITVAKLYATKPMYYEDQDTFLNTVLKGETHLSPQELLTAIKQIEQQLGRKKRFRNGPREIDIDILFYDDTIMQSEHLIIPHPAIQERDFVLKPFMDIDPDFVHPVLKSTIKNLFNNLREK